MRKCLFCDNPADSREHVIPDWILKRLNVREEMRLRLGDDPVRLLKSPEHKVRAVCSECNNGWMHDLEIENIPIIGSLMQDVAISLNGLQQYRLAVWASKMSMLGDFLARSHRPLFFDQCERVQLRVAGNLPLRSTIWIARYQFPDHIGIWGTNAAVIDETIQAFITTVLVGHLAVQVLTLQCSERWDGKSIEVRAEPFRFPWPQLLTQIWPTTVSAQWPPRFGFTDGRGLPLMTLVRRYSYGMDRLKAGLGQIRKM